MKTRSIRSAQDVREDFLRRGVSISQWARDHGLPVATVVQVLNGRNAATYGQGHKVAVMLGIKDGIIEGDDGEGSHAA